MAANKMFPPREIENPFGDDYDEVKLGISFRILAGQIVMRFSDHVEWIRMTSGGARRLAARLTEKADELDRRENVPAPRVKPAHPPKARVRLCRRSALRAPRGSRLNDEESRSDRRCLASLGDDLEGVRGDRRCDL